MRKCYNFLPDVSINSNTADFIILLSASLYVSKRGAYWDRRDVVGRWLSRACTVAKRCILGQAYSYYGTLIENPTPGIQWYNFLPPGVTPNRGMGPREALFVKLIWPLVVFIGSIRLKWVPEEETLKCHRQTTLQVDRRQTPLPSH